MRLLCGDTRELLKTLDAESVQCVVTSPPYWGLRDYGVTGQIGLEQSPDAYVAELVAVFQEIRRALRPDGVVWLNLGDSYAREAGPERSKRATKHTIGTGYIAVVNAGADPDKKNRPPEGLKPKDLVGIPWRVAFALQADGWYLRSDIIWAKPNPMPESVKDRPTRSHEYVFLLTKSAKYFYDAKAIAEPSSEPDRGPREDRIGGNKHNATKHSDQSVWKGFDGFNDRWNAGVRAATKNARSVWLITPQSYKGAHFATFPEALAERCIRAGSREGDIVLDPFMGSGTVGQVCRSLKREFVGIDLNAEYLKLAEARISSPTRAERDAAKKPRKVKVVREEVEPLLPFEEELRPEVVL